MSVENLPDENLFEENLVEEAAPEKWKENKRKYIRSYNKKTYYQFPITFHKEKEKDLIEYFSMIPHKNKYVKNLIREDINRYKKNLT